MSKSPRFLHSYSSQESAETDKYIGDFAKLRVIERVAYDFQTLVSNSEKTLSSAPSLSKDVLDLSHSYEYICEKPPA